MPEYRYVALNSEGKRIKGVKQVATVAELAQQLQQQQRILIKFDMNHSRRYGLPQSAMSRWHLVLFTQQLQQLLQADVALDVILQELAQHFEIESLRPIFAGIERQVQGGLRLSQALSFYPQHFNSLYISMVKLGEETGQLAAVLHSLQTLLEWEMALWEKGQKLLRYPLMVLLVLFSVVLFILGVLVPELLGFITQVGGELDWPTRLLLSLSSIVRDYGVLGSVILTLMVGLLWVAFRWSSRLRVKWHYWALKWPIVGRLSRQLKLARFAYALAVMLRSGMTLPQSLNLAQDLLNNRYLINQVVLLKARLEAGERFYLAAQHVDLWSPMGLRLLKIGELNRDLACGFEQVSGYDEQQAQAKIDRIEPTLAPLLSIMMAILVGWVMLAVLGPVYDSLSQLQ